MNQLFFGRLYVKDCYAPPCRVWYGGVYLFTIFDILFSTLLSAQVAPQVLWEKSFGGSGTDEAGQIRQTKDGGYVVAGESNSNDGDISSHHGNTSSPDYWIIKISAVGTKQWQKSLGGSGTDICGAIELTSDGGYIIAGQSNSLDGDVTGNHGGSDYWVVKLDSFGAVQWEKSYGGKSEDIATCVKQTFDLGYIVTGWSYSNDGDVTLSHGRSDAWVVKIDALGIIQWEKSFGGSSWDYAYNVSQTSDSGYVVVGSSQSNDFDVGGNHGATDCWVLKLDKIGNVQWSRSLGGSSLDVGTSIQQTIDGGYVVGAVSQSNDGDVTGHHGPLTSADIWIIKLDSKGSIQWENSLGGGLADQVSSIRSTMDTGYIVAGWSNSNDGDVTGNRGNSDDWIVKLNNVGGIEWETSMGGSGDDFATDIRQTGDNGFVVAGTSSSLSGEVSGNHGLQDYWIVKLNYFPIITSVQQILFDTVRCATMEWETLWVHNVGLAPLMISSMSLTNNQNFKILFGTTISDTIPVGDSLRVIVQCFPSTAEAFTSTLNIFSSDTLHNPWPITIIGRKDSIGFAISGIANEIIDFGYTTCGTTQDSLFTLASTSTIATTYLLNNHNPVFTIASSAYLAAGVQQPISIHFAGAASPGRFIDSLTITDTCGRSSTVFLAATVDAPAFAISRVADTTICPTDSLVRFVTVQNVSHVTQTLQLAGNAALFSVAPNSVTIKAGESTVVNVVFHGSPIVGAYSASYNLVDNCGGALPFTASIHVDTSHIAVPAAFDSVICPLTPTVFTLPIRNNDAVSRTITLNSSAWMLSKTNLVLAGGQNDSVTISFPGGAVGAYSNTVHVTDDCGGIHDIVLNVIVQKQPPLQLSIQADPAVTVVGTERTVFVLAQPISAISSGISFTLANEPTALQFDSISSSCNIIPTIGLNSVSLALGNCPALPSDTVAVLYYRTLVGSTLTPSVTLQNVQTSNTCDIVTSNQQPATINLLPPGCELGTVIVHPFTSEIQSIYPNPATGETVITYSTIENTKVQLRICDALGRTVQTLVNTAQNPGIYTAAFDTEGLVNGVYFAELRAGSFVQTREMLMMR